MTCFPKGTGRGCACVIATPVNKIRGQILAKLGRLVASSLQPRQTIYAGSAATLADAKQRTIAIQHRLDGLEQRLRDAVVTGPFVETMTVDAALRRHQEASMVFAQHHLPACADCAVRFDETIAEVSSAYGLNLDNLLSQLNALLT